MSELSHIEDLYTRILRIVHRGIGIIEEKELLGPNDVKILETYDKITRSALEIYGKKKPVSEMTSMSDEELEAALEEGE